MQMERRRESAHCFIYDGHKSKVSQHPFTDHRYKQGISQSKSRLDTSEEPHTARKQTQQDTAPTIVYVCMFEKVLQILPV